MLDSKQLLCYLNYMTNQMLFEWRSFQRTHLCRSSDACELSYDDINLMDNWKIDNVQYLLAEYFNQGNYSTDLFFEELSSFDDWTQKKKVLHLNKHGVDLDFFIMPPEHRDMFDFLEPFDTDPTES